MYIIVPALQSAPFLSLLRKECYLKVQKVQCYSLPSLTEYHVYDPTTAIQIRGIKTLDRNAEH